MKQLNLIPRQKSDIEFGGDLSKGKRKSKRPLSTKLPMHLILKSSYAKSKYAFSPSDYRLQNLIYRMAARFNIKIYSVASNWSHIHIVLRLKDRKNYNSFIRAISGAMVLMLKASKGFFDLRPYTKIGTWGRQLKNWMNYSVKNQMQAAGMDIKSRNEVGRRKTFSPGKKTKEFLLEADVEYSGLFAAAQRNEEPRFFGLSLVAKNSNCSEFYRFGENSGKYRKDLGSG